MVDEYLDEREQAELLKQWFKENWLWMAAGIGLGSAGEFSLVLMGKTAQLTTWPDGLNQPLLAAMALSMALVPSAMLTVTNLPTSELAVVISF